VTGWADGDALTGAGSWNLRNFGYFFGRGSVSARVTNETAEAVHYINEYARGHDQPGVSCETDDQKIAVWKCFLVAAAQGKKATSSEATNCFTLNKCTFP
jgi:hypothetical protein